MDIVIHTQQFINEIIDDIITNNLALSSLKVNLHQWQGKEEFYYLQGEV
jgi:hypothetical protein